MSVNSSFWRGRRVLVTGHTGFKGSWLTLWLHHMGAQVSGYALVPDTQPSLFELTGLGAVMGKASRFADVRDAQTLSRALHAEQPEVVFHMAAQPLVRRSYVEPVDTYATNVMGTVHLLQAVRATASVRAVVNVTTDKCYENREWVWGYREGEALGGRDPYSSSKACSELVTHAFRASFFGPGQHAAGVATARAGNVIGGGDWAADRLVPDVLAAFSSGRPVQLRSPGATRPWQHVLEPLGAYLLLAQRLVEQQPEASSAFNFGPADDGMCTVQRVVSLLAQHWGPGAAWQADPGSHPHEAGLLKLDIAKARSVLGWHPSLMLDEALGWTVDWHRHVHGGGNAREISLRQIEAFAERLARRPVS